MPEFGDSVGPFITNLIQSIREEADRLPPLSEVVEKVREFDPSPQEITDFAGKCADAVLAAGKAIADLVGRAPSNGKADVEMPDHIDIPDDLSGL
jgi:hypothetical protein